MIHSMGMQGILGITIGTSLSRSSMGRHWVLFACYYIYVCCLFSVLWEEIIRPCRKLPSGRQILTCSRFDAGSASQTVDHNR